MSAPGRSRHPHRHRHRHRHPNRGTRSPPMGGGPGRGGPFGGMGMPVEKAMSFVPSAKRLFGRLHPERAGVILVVALGVISVVLSVIGPKLLGTATNIIFEGVISSQLPAGATKAEVIAQLEASGDTQRADLIRGLTLDPGAGIDFNRLSMVLGIVLLLYVFASIFGYLQGYVLNGDHPAHGLSAARGGGGEDPPPAAQLLRPHPARRAAQPSHQRHRQHLAEPAADDEPAAHLSADRRRRAGDDVLHLAPAGAHRARHDPADPGPCDGDRQALAEEVRGAMARDGGAERPDRGGVQRTCPRQGLRPAAGHHGPVRRDKRQALHVELRRAVHQRPDHAGVDVRRKPRLRRHRRGRRAHGLGWLDVPRRRAGLHPVLPPVHPAAHPARLDGQPAAVGRRELRAGLRAARRAEQIADPVPAESPPDTDGPPRVRGRLVPYTPTSRCSRALTDRRARIDRRDRRTDRRGQDDPGQPRHALLRGGRRADHPRRRRHRRR